MPYKIKDRKKEDVIIQGIVRDIKKLPEVKAIVLFGSYARGEQKPLSDIDICIITKKNISESKKKEFAGYASDKIDISVFWDLPVTVRYAVLREGKILFERDKEFLHSVVVKTMSEYLDFRHIIEKNVQRVFGNEL